MTFSRRAALFLHDLQAGLDLPMGVVWISDFFIYLVSFVLLATWDVYTGV